MEKKALYKVSVRFFDIPHAMLLVYVYYVIAINEEQANSKAIERVKETELYNRILPVEVMKCEKLSTDQKRIVL